MIQPSTPDNFATQPSKAKLDKGKLAKRIARLVRSAGLDYDGWRYVSKRVRKLVGLAPGKRPKKLPRILPEADFAKFYAEVDKANNVQHSLMLRLLFYSSVRVSELCRIKVEDVDLTTCKIRIAEGKGSKDRYVLFARGFALTLKTYLASRDTNPYLFSTRLGGPFTSRRVQQIVGQYARSAGVQATPHTFRHQAITWLTKQGMADAELQLITGHTRRETLAIYQHIALGGEVEAKYQEAMRKAEL